MPDPAPSLIEDDDLEISGSRLTKRMRYLNRTLDHFWKRWKAEYFMELRESRYRGATSGKDDDTISVGDIVSVHSESRPRGLWKLASAQIQCLRLK